VDLSAIAKGYGVDRVALRLEEAGCTDYLVDVGGEVRARGASPRGDAWRVGIEVPDPERIGGVQRVLALHDLALATSGDYRNFIDLDGGRYSHTIDPRTGRPVSHRLASVTVAHPSAMWADGYATAINVLGPERGIDLAERLGLPVLLLVHAENGFQERYTPAFTQLLQD
jgi:thiamine biosynthesis lipoprotein